MSAVSTEVAIAQLLAVLDEGITHPDKPFSYFTDSAPDAGLLALLDTLDAETASRQVGGSSVAAQVKHLQFGMEASAGWIKGERNPRDWEMAWKADALDDAAWQKLRRDLRADYEKLREAIIASGASSVEAVGGTAGVVAHVAYHLGAIKQKLACLKG